MAPPVQSTLRLAALALLIVFPALPAQIAAQDDPGFLLFTVTDATTREPVAGAAVELIPTDRIVITDAAGRAGFRDVAAGDYEVSVRRIGYVDRVAAVSVSEEGQLAEVAVELAPTAVAVDPIEVRVTGRDPYLVTSGFYERRAAIGDDGYFGTREEIESYTMVPTLFQFQRDLTIRFGSDRIVLLNGRPLEQFGYERISDLREMSFRRVRGVEAYPCNRAPSNLMMRIPPDVPLGKCNLIAIWTR